MAATGDELLKHIEALAQVGTNLTPTSGPVDKATLQRVISELVGALGVVHREIQNSKKA